MDVFDKYLIKFKRRITFFSIVNLELIKLTQVLY